MIIDQLPAISNVQGTDELAVERGTTTYKGTVAQILGTVTEIVAEDYDNTATYDEGDYCIHEAALYICNTTISTAEDWTPAHWDATTVADEIGDVQAKIATKQDKITASGILKGDGSGGVSAATLGTDYGNLAFTVTLTAAGWSGNAQTVSNQNFIASGFAYIVTPAGTSIKNYGAAEIYADNVTVAGQMTFHCTTVPSSDLTVNILRGVSA